MMISNELRTAAREAFNAALQHSPLPDAFDHALRVFVRTMRDVSRAHRAAADRKCQKRDRKLLDARINVRRLQRTIADAPHGPDCATATQEDSHCDCWKSRLPIIQETRVC